MTLREKQSIFLLNVSKLIQWAFANGYELTGGELFRTEDQQKLYLANHESTVIRSRHEDRLAIDLCLFINGEYKTDNEDYKPLAVYWKSLHPDNRSGFDWGWDANHFEMK